MQQRRGQWVPAQGSVGQEQEAQCGSVQAKREVQGGLARGRRVVCHSSVQGTGMCPRAQCTGQGGGLHHGSVQGRGDVQCAPQLSARDRGTLTMAQREGQGDVHHGSAQVTGGCSPQLRSRDWGHSPQLRSRDWGCSLWFSARDGGLFTMAQCRGWGMCNVAQCKGTVTHVPCPNAWDVQLGRGLSLLAASGSRAGHAVGTASLGRKMGCSVAAGRSGSTTARPLRPSQG